MQQISSKHAYVVANEVELAWLTHYPRPLIITLGHLPLMNDAFYEEGLHFACLSLSLCHLVL
jgi:hypothetical protein